MHLEVSSCLSGQQRRLHLANSSALPVQLPRRLELENWKEARRFPKFIGLGKEANDIKTIHVLILLGLCGLLQ